MHACKQTKDLKKDIFSEKHLALKYKLIDYRKYLMSNPGEY